MDNRIKILIGIAIVTVIGIAIIGFIWLRTRDTGGAPVVQTPSSGSTSTPDAPPTDSQQKIIDELSKAPQDTDGDLLPDSEEAAAGTDPANPDSDGDGESDGYEKLNGTDPLQAQPPRIEEQAPPPPPAPSPAAPAPDRDRDGLTDEQEATRGTNPDRADTDNDGLTDLEEIVTYKTDPTKADTDGDSFNDGQEVKAKYNPLGPGPCARETCIP